MSAEHNPMDTLPEQLVAEFFSSYSQSHAPGREVIDRLAKLALSEDHAVAEQATRAIFAGIVEPLADSFQPDDARLYNRIFAQIIQICRNDSRAAALDRELAGFGLSSEEDLVARAEGLRRVPRLIVQNLKRVIVLSRVTLGADVAITSVILERAKLLFPGAEVVLVGGRKTSELFGGDRRLQCKEIDYQRSAVLIERLQAWIDLLASVREITYELSDEEFLIVDPDSRLTQLGLLPITKMSTAAESLNYLFFPSREYGSDTTKSLAELTSAWLDETFGEGEVSRPRVTLKHEDVEIARRLATQHRGDRSRRLVAINFGVGENPLKRVGADFENSLINRLCEEDVAIILDKGAGAQEATLVETLTADAMRSEHRPRPVRVIEFNEDDLLDFVNTTSLDADILVWNGRIGVLAALIGESDLYIGYDSAGQHIAAALGVPSIDIFTGHSSSRMLDRWRPTGSAETHVVVVDRVSDDLVERCVRMAKGKKDTKDIKDLSDLRI